VIGAADRRPLDPVIAGDDPESIQFIVIKLESLVHKPPMSVHRPDVNRYAKTTPFVLVRPLFFNLSDQMAV
jgi:hypothetical protein